MSEKLADELIAEYLTIEDEVKALRDKQATLKAELLGVLGISDNTDPQSFVYDDIGSATWVRGRKSSKLDRSLLVRSGVTADIINKCTVETVGKPHLRIEPPKME